MRRTIISLGVFKDSGGPTKTIGAFQRALSAEIHCFCSQEELDVGRLAVEGSVAVKASRWPILKQLRYAGKYADHGAETAVAQSSIVSCHSFYRYHSIWVNRMSKKYGFPYWFVPHGILDPWVLEYGKFAKRLFLQLGGRRFLDEASTVIFSTKAERDKAKQGFDLKATDVVPWPVDLVNIGMREQSRKNIRRELGIEDDAHVLLYFGRLHHMKRPLETIQAVAAAKEDMLHLIIVGNEQTVSLKDCHEQAASCGIGNRVHLVGPVYGESKYDYLHASDAYISLSHRENFNHTAAESLAAGLPVILSPGNDLQSEIDSENCSWRVGGDRVQDAAAAISAFVNCPAGKRDAMGCRGRGWVERELGFARFQEHLLGLAARYARV